jgi:hypothetical protein
MRRTAYRRPVKMSDLDRAYIRLTRKGRRTVDWRMLYAEMYGAYPDGPDRKFIARVSKWARLRGLETVRRRRRSLYR